MTLAQKIVYLRKKANLSQKELAQKIGVSTGTVAEWESEDTIPTLTDISKLSEFFSVSTDMLIKETEALDGEKHIPKGSKEETAGQGVDSTKKPFWKQVWFWVVTSIVLIAAVLTTILLLNSEVKPRIDKDGKPIFVDLTDEVYTNADKYLGYYVEVKGKVFQNLGDNGEIKGIQVWIDPDNCEQNLMIHYSTEESFKDGDYVICTGYIKEMHSYTNTYGTELSVPLIYSTDLRDANYIEVMSPTKATITPKDLTYEKHGYSITIDKIEFAENETRLYLTAINNGKATLFVDTDSSIILQNGKQFNSETNYEADYTEVPYNLSKGAKVSGIVAFPPVDIGDFEYSIEIHSDNVDEQFEGVLFKINKDASTVFVPIDIPNDVWDFDGLKYETQGYEIVIDKIEFYAEETRVYLTANNNGKATLNVDADGSIIVQEKKQYNTISIYDAPYNELPYSIAKGASASGAISFPAIKVAEFEYRIQMHSDDYDEDFEDIVFVINEKSPSCKNDSQQDPSADTKPSQNTGSNENIYTAAITVAQSYVNAYSSATPNEVKVHMQNNYSEAAINHALYSGYINWSNSIRDYIWELHCETNFCISKCLTCDQAYYGDYQLCPINESHGTPNRSWYYGYSRAETISRLLAVGFLQSDINDVMAEYPHGEFVDEVDLGEYVDPTDMPTTAKNNRSEEAVEEARWMAYYDYTATPADIQKRLVNELEFSEDDAWYCIRMVDNAALEGSRYSWVERVEYYVTYKLQDYYIEYTWCYTCEEVFGVHTTCPICGSMGTQTGQLAFGYTKSEVIAKLQEEGFSDGDIQEGLSKIPEEKFYDESKYKKP